MKSTPLVLLFAFALAEKGWIPGWFSLGCIAISVIYDLVEWGLQQK